MIKSCHALGDHNLHIWNDAVCPGNGPFLDREMSSQLIRAWIMLDTAKDPCQCTDSIHKGSRCPQPGHREYYMCPKHKAALERAKPPVAAENPFGT